MGSLKPGATYIYERANNVVYAREFGDPPEKRFEIGSGPYTAKEAESRILGLPARRVVEIAEWMHAAEEDPAMAEMLDKVRVYYNLKKSHA